MGYQRYPTSGVPDPLVVDDLTVNDQATIENLSVTNLVTFNDLTVNDLATIQEADVLGTLNVASVLEVSSISGGSSYFQSQASNGASTRAFVLDTLNTLDGASAKLLSLRNGGTEQLYVSKIGDITAPISSLTLSSQVDHSVLVPSVIINADHGADESDDVILSVQSQGFQLFTFDVQGRLSLLGSGSSIDVAGSVVAGSVIQKVGESATNQTLVGVINTSVTATANSGAGETTLASYSFPANGLSANGKGVRITAWGSTAANGNSKTIRLKFGSTDTLNNAFTTSTTSLGWRCTATILRNGAATQTATAQGTFSNNTGNSVNTAPAATLSGAVTIACTGQGTSTNDITIAGFIVEVIN